jgi:predicted dehydrogenase
MRAMRGSRAPRVGVVGTGFGARVMAPNFRQAGCEIVEVVSARDATAVEALCRQDIDLISIHAPPFLHLPYVRMAIESGRDVICDKPFGASLAEAEVMATEADRAGVVHFVNFEFRYQPARQLMHEMITSGAIGRTEHLHYSAFTGGSRLPLRPYGWLFDRSRGGGWIGAFGSHAIDMVRWLLGEITEAGASGWINIPTRLDRQSHPRTCDAEDAFVGWMQLSSGATATIDTSFTTAVPLPPRIAVHGSEGLIENTADRRVVLRRLDGTAETHEFPRASGDPHDVAVGPWTAAVIDAVADRRQIAPSFADGAACSRIMDLMRSHPPSVTAHQR